jgi:hypothetical protein
MKIIFFTMALLSGLMISTVKGQNYKPYPIPSYNVIVDDPAAFQETAPATNRAKRDVKVTIKPGMCTDTTTCYAEVLVYSTDHQTILGPYIVYCGETLTVPIDERAWGVVVTSETAVEVSVWIDEESLNKVALKPIQKTGQLSLDKKNNWPLSL